MIRPMAGAAARLAAQLRRRLACAGLQPGDLLPSVRAIEQDFSVSRSVVTEALDLLAAEGLLVRHHGRGTYLLQVPPLATAGVHVALVLTVGLKPQDPYLERVITGLADAASVHRCSLVLRNAADDGHDVPASVAASAANGIIMVGEVTAAVITAAAATGLPCVVASGVAAPSLAAGASWVGHDDHEGAYQATQHLVALGRRRIAWIAGDLNMPYNQERHAGHREALRDAGLAFDPTLICTDVGNNSILAQLMTTQDPPTGAIICGDYLAQRTYNTITALGRVVGRDCSVVGFDDLALAAQVTPTLTTMRAEVEKLGAESLRLLMNRLAGTAAEAVMIPRRMVRRNSTCSAVSQPT